MQNFLEHPHHVGQKLSENSSKLGLTQH
uniref:Uncharacterized protein n=1 Tax=Arundo donax TaxID=35708 RepID=A0A0A8XU18_ARUDO